MMENCVTPIVYGCRPRLMKRKMVRHTDNGTCASDCLDVEMDGYTYSVVQIGDQCWFAENLRTAVYANGDSIPSNLSDEEWTQTGLPFVVGTAVYEVIVGSSERPHL